MLALAGLFLAALLAATLIPAQSELVLAGLLLAGQHPAWVLIAVASLGNVLGSLINWVIGRVIAAKIAPPQDSLPQGPASPLPAPRRGPRWFPINPAQLRRAEQAYHRWGWLSLFLSWVPVIGDPLTLAAGLLREPLWRFVLVVGAAKTGRYLLLAWATLQIGA